MAYAKTKEEWGSRASAHLKAEIRKAEVTYAELVRRLKKHGFKDETEAGITMKLKRARGVCRRVLAGLSGRPGA